MKNHKNFLKGSLKIAVALIALGMSIYSGKDGMDDFDDYMKGGDKDEK